VHDFDYVLDAHMRRDYRGVIYPGFAYLEAILREGCVDAGLLHRRLHNGRMKTAFIDGAKLDLYLGMGKLHRPLESMGAAGSVKRRIGTDWAAAVMGQVNEIRKAVEHCQRPSAVKAKLAVAVLLFIAAAVELFDSPE